MYDLFPTKSKPISAIFTYYYNMCRKFTEGNYEKGGEETGN
jgi:hypothetical protein